MYFYLTIKVLHIVALFAWFAGLFYLPRLMVYHTMLSVEDKSYVIFSTMEKKLFFIIMVPAMMVAILSGTFLASSWVLLHGLPVWLWLKLIITFMLVIFSIFLYRCGVMFKLGLNNYTERFYRIINEIPTVLLIIAVSAVVYKW